MQQMGAEGNSYITQKRTKGQKEIYMVTSTTPVVMWSRRKLVTMEMKIKRKRSLPRNPSWRNEAGMEMILDMLTMVRSYKLVWKWATQLGALDIQQILTGIKEHHKKQLRMGKYVMTMGMIFKNGKQLSIATLCAFINFVQWESNGNSNMRKW